MRKVVCAVVLGIAGLLFVLELDVQAGGRAPRVEALELNDVKAKSFNKALKEGVNKAATLKDGEELFVRVKDNEVVELFAQDAKGKKIEGEVRKFTVEGKVKICFTNRKGTLKACLTLEKTATK